MQAVGVRLRRNYVWLYAVIFVAWLAKLNVHPTAAGSTEEIIRRMAIGPVPALSVLAGVSVFWVVVLALVVRESRRRRHAGEVHGIAKAMDRWKD